MPSRGQLRLLVSTGALAGLGLLVGGLLLLPILPLALVWALPFLAAYAAGLVSCRVQPENLAARRLLLFGTTALVWLALSELFLLGVDASGVQPWFTLGNTAAQAAGLWMATSIMAMLAVYPDGGVSGAAPGRVVAVLVGLGAFLPVVLLLSTERVEPSWILQWATDSSDFSISPPPSPVYVEQLAWLGGPASFLLESSLGLVPAIGVLILAVRYRDLDEAQRARVAWPLLSAAVLVLLSVDDVLVSYSGATRVALDVAEGASLVLLPVSLGIGIARPRLFDAMGALRRMIVFALLSAGVLALYVALAWLLGLAVGRDNLRIAVVVAVLAAVALDPVRRALVRRAARVAYGRAVPRDELLRRLGETLEHTLDRDELTAAIAASAREGLGVAWVRVDVDGAASAQSGRPPGEDRPCMVARLRQGERDLGSIACGPLMRGRRSSQTRALLDTLARQAALALTNARLVGELEEHLGELAASRERLVDAEESARRKLERDLHDGSQQEIAALLSRIALAQRQLGRRDAHELGRTLDTLQVDAQQALTNLREIASGLHASVLADRGLVEAIETRVSRLPIRVEVECGPGVRDGRLSDSVEGAAYFLVCEALANTLKHGNARSAVVELRFESDVLRIDVTDDGRGFDPDVIRRGGLAGLADRLSALGGTLEVASCPGAGTRLAAVLPSRS